MFQLSKLLLLCWFKTSRVFAQVSWIWLWWVALSFMATASSDSSLRQREHLLIYRLVAFSPADDNLWAVVIFLNRCQVARQLRFIKCSCYTFRKTTTSNSQRWYRTCMLLDITDQRRFCYMISRLLRLNFESASDVMTSCVVQKVASQLHLLNNSPIYTECACGTYPLPYG